MMDRKKLYYQGITYRRYDLVKEFLLALVGITILTIILAAVLSSPDEPSITTQSVALTSPATFLETSLNALDGNSDISSYGPPYNNGTDSVQYIGPLSLQKLVGVHIPVDTARDFIIRPLSQASGTSPKLRSALSRFNAASSKQQDAWEKAYDKALSKAKENPPRVTVPRCACGPVRPMMSAMLKLGQTGALDGLLLANRHFFQTDYTRPLLFMQNDAVEKQAEHFNLLGTQWGVMNETGNYPGQAWLWLYTMLYQINPYNTAWSANTDALALLTVTLLSLILMFLPWIPVLNRIPRWVPVYKLIWREYYREQRQTPSSTPGPEPERT